MQRYLSTCQISEYLEISISTVGSRNRAGNFPVPDVIIGNRSQGWTPEKAERHSCLSAGGPLTRYATRPGAAIGMVCGLAPNLWL
jgi:hypothetical protein